MRWRNSPPLKKEKAKKDVLGEGLPIYDGIDLPVCCPSKSRHRKVEN